jgi:hypothetical protein
MNHADKHTLTVTLAGIASEELKTKVLNKLQEIARVSKVDEPTIVDKGMLLAGFYCYKMGVCEIDGEIVPFQYEQAINTGVFVIDGDFGRSHYEQAIVEAMEAGLNTSRIHVVAETCSYPGQTLSFMKLSDLGLRGAPVDTKKGYL